MYYSIKELLRLMVVSETVQNNFVGVANFKLGMDLQYLRIMRLENGYVHEIILNSVSPRNRMRNEVTVENLNSDSIGGMPRATSTNTE